MFRYNRLLNSINNFYKKAIKLNNLVKLAQEENNDEKVQSIIDTLITLVNEDSKSKKPTLSQSTKDSIYKISELFRWAMDDEYIARFKIDINDVYNAINRILDNSSMSRDIENFDNTKDEEDITFDTLFTDILNTLDEKYSSMGKSISTYDDENMTESDAQKLFFELKEEIGEANQNEPDEGEQAGEIMTGVAPDEAKEFEQKPGGYSKREDLTPEQAAYEAFQGRDAETGKGGGTQIRTEYVQVDPVQKYRNKIAQLNILSKSPSANFAVKQAIAQYINVLEQLIKVVPQRNEAYDDIYNNTDPAARDKANGIKNGILGLKEILADQIQIRKGKTHKADGTAYGPKLPTKYIQEVQDKLVEENKKLKQMKPIIINGVPPEKQMLVVNFNKLNDEVKQLSKLAYRFSEQFRDFRLEKDIENKEKQIASTNNINEKRLYMAEKQLLELFRNRLDVGRKEEKELLNKLIERLNSTTPPTDEEYNSYIEKIKNAHDKIIPIKKINEKEAEEIRSAMGKAPLSATEKDNINFIERKIKELEAEKIRLSYLNITNPAIDRDIKKFNTIYEKIINSELSDKEAFDQINAIDIKQVVQYTTPTGKLSERERSVKRLTNKQFDFDNATIDGHVKQIKDSIANERKELKERITQHIKKNLGKYAEEIDFLATEIAKAGTKARKPIDKPKLTASIKKFRDRLIEILKEEKDIVITKTISENYPHFTQFVQSVIFSRYLYSFRDMVAGLESRQVQEKPILDPDDIDYINNIIHTGRTLLSLHSKIEFPSRGPIIDGEEIKTLKETKSEYRPIIILIEGEIDYLKRLLEQKAK